MIHTIQTSSLEKIMPKAKCKARIFKKCSAFKNETVSYQIAFKTDELCNITLSVDNDIKDYIEVFYIKCVPVMLPAYPESIEDKSYISHEPGLFPDICEPFDGTYVKSSNFYQSFRINASCPIPGKHNINITLSDGKTKATETFTLQVLPLELPEQELLFTQWFHADCIAGYYNVKPWSAKHWKLVEKFIQIAAEHGMNMILTPIFTPPLDTEIGGERQTVQLVKITKNGNKYDFDFELLGKWFDICLKNGIKYFEMTHLFTQWGAEFTPKIVVSENGKDIKMFGWHIKSIDEGYKNFLSQFLPALTEYITARGLKNVTFFHISDEPTKEQLESYKKAKAIAEPYLKGFKIIDALSDFEFYKNGAVEYPVIATDHIEPFIGNVPELYCYYCCLQGIGVSNRFVAMPSYRNRSIAAQFFKFNVKLFLHWGFNFYNSQFSKKKINPFCVTDAEIAFPSGDAFSVYPYPDGPVPSISLEVFRDALQDLRAFRLLESLAGYEKTLEIIENFIGTVNFDKCTDNPHILLSLREAVNKEIMRYYIKKI